MGLYQLKEEPTVEAYRWLPDDAGTPSANRLADWLDEHEAEWSTDGVGQHCVIKVLGADDKQQIASRGDWVIRGVTGLFRVLSDDQFHATYESVQ